MKFFLGILIIFQYFIIQKLSIFYEIGFAKQDHMETKSCYNSNNNYFFIFSTHFKTNKICRHHFVFIGFIIWSNIFTIGILKELTVNPRAIAVPILFLITI